MIASQHIPPLGDGACFTQCPSRPSLGSPHKQRPSRRNPRIQDQELLMPPKGHVAVDPISTNLDNHFPMCVLPVEKWSQSLWATGGINHHVQETREFVDLDGSSAMELDTEYIYPDLTQPFLDPPDTRSTKSPELGPESPPYWPSSHPQYKDDTISSLSEYAAESRPGSYSSKPAAFRFSSAFIDSDKMYHAPRTPEGSFIPNASFWDKLDSSPFPAPNSDRSRPDRSMALLRTQERSQIMNTVVNTPTTDSERSASNIILGMGDEIFGDPIHWQSLVSPYHDTSHGSQCQFDGSNSMTASPRWLEPPATLSVTNAAESNNDQHTSKTSCAPNLFASLYEPSLKPSPSTNTIPFITIHYQHPRFPGDLYAPTFIRNEGNKREGWCGLCRPGRWLVLKNSAFWYDKSFTHGISAASGKVWDGPCETRRGKKGKTWEGLCGTCGQWIVLVANKKGGISWFRHAYKCHTHVKAKKSPQKASESKVARVSKKVKAVEHKEENRARVLREIRQA